MKYYKHIFIVLVYKNTEVLTGFFESLSKLDDYKVILVNAFYDIASEESCMEIAKKHDADFLSIQNVGYGEGNNQGVDYVLKHYSFQYLIVSNSDIIVKDLAALNSLKLDNAVIAPDTRMLSGKAQNPCMWKFSSLYYKLMKWSSKNDWYYIMWSAFVVTRFYKIVFQLYKALVRKQLYRVFSPHGSFFIVTSEAVRRLHPMFNKEMFLYNEEMHLGLNCKMHDIPVYYMPKLSVLHLEGASTGRDMRKVCKECRKSFLIMDNAWFGKKEQ